MFGLTRWNSFDDVFNFQREADRLFNQFWSDLPTRPVASSGPSFQVHATDDGWRIDVPMPAQVGQAPAGSLNVNWNACIRSVMRIRDVRNPCGSRSRISGSAEIAPGPMRARPANSTPSGPSRWPWTSIPLVHWPVARLGRWVETWRALVRLREELGDAVGVGWRRVSPSGASGEQSKQQDEKRYRRDEGERLHSSYIAPHLRRVVRAGEWFVWHFDLQELAQGFPPCLYIVDEQPGPGNTPLDLRVVALEDLYGVVLVLEAAVEGVLPILGRTANRWDRRDLGCLLRHRRPALRRPRRLLRARSTFPAPRNTKKLTSL